MISPISRTHSTDAHQVSQPPNAKQPPKPAPEAQAPQTLKSGTLSSDQVTLKSAGQVDRDPNSK